MGIQHPFTAQTMAREFVQGVIRLHGVSKSIISSLDKIFTSRFWTNLFKLQGTTLKYSTAYHPQIDRQYEVVN